MISHANGHINWTAQFLVPFIVLAALRLRTWKDGIPLALLVLYQAFINEEVLLYTALALAVFMGCLRLDDQDAGQAGAAGAGGRGRDAGAVAGLSALPPVLRRPDLQRAARERGALPRRPGFLPGLLAALLRR